MDGHTGQLVTALLIAMGRLNVTITHEDWEQAGEYTLTSIKTGDREETRVELEKRK